LATGIKRIGAEVVDTKVVVVPVADVDWAKNFAQHMVDEQAGHPGPGART
jgi:hypothetical protein